MIGIIVAMEKELAGWLERVAVREIVAVADKTIYLATHRGTELAIARSGIGKVNAAMTAALLFSRYPLAYAVSTGVAGGVSPARPGDIVVGDRILYADVDVRGIDPALEAGRMPGEALYADSDPALVARAETILKQLGYRHRVGAVASADRFVTDPADLAAVRAHTPSIVAVDMESMAIALVAAKFAVPFILIRGVSDVIDAADQAKIYRDVVETVGRRTAELVVAFVSEG